MPPTHAQPLTPRLGQTPAGSKVAAALTTKKSMPVPVPRVPPAAPPAAVADDDDAAEAKARAGGFHESSYELKQGLDVSESEWPPDITAPGALGLR